MLDRYSETIKFWLEQLYDQEIKGAYGTISNEHIWEIGYDGEEPNPHTENIKQLQEYIRVLDKLKGELK